MDDAKDPCGHEEDAMGEKLRDPQENINPLQCWRCGGTHLCRSCPHGEGYARPAYNIQENETEADGKRGQESSLDATTTIRSLRVELQGCKEENKRMIKELVEKRKMTSVMLQSLADLQRKIKYGHLTSNT